MRLVPKTLLFSCCVLGERLDICRYGVYMPLIYCFYDTPWASSFRFRYTDVLFIRSLEERYVNNEY
jgi:hypothetical protein